MEPNDMIFYENADEKIYAGGFSVNSVMMKNGISPILTLNNPKMNNENFSDLFDNIVVPNWAFYLPTNNKIGGNNETSYVKNDHDNTDEYSDDEDDIIDDDLHNKLLDLVKPEIKKGGKKSTRKHKQNKNNLLNKRKTKRNKH